MVKLELEGSSLKEIFEDLFSSFEEMGMFLVKSNEEIPESLEEFLKKKGVILYRPGNVMPEGLVKSVIEDDQEGVIDFLLENQEPRERLLERLEEVLKETKTILFKPGDGISEELLEALVKEDREKLLDFLLENEEIRQRIQDKFSEK